jgi:hypothetical protein
MLDGLPAWTAHLEYQELLSGPLLVKLCIEVICCFYLEPRIRLKPFTIQCRLKLAYAPVLGCCIVRPQLDQPNGDAATQHCATHLHREVTLTYSACPW